ncbi:MAG: hypothetical protein EP329_27250 [Deltaproteobacteria bacterium]|nr:MAG: hypothetical protein EP329_27250 [Deltaproteobacteria bacterium]
MRRFLTMTTIALSTLFAAPVLASPGGAGNGPGNHANGANGYGNGSGYNHIDDSGGRFGVPGPGVTHPAGVPVLKPQPLRVLSKAELKKAQALQRSYTRQRVALVRQLNAAKQQLRTLKYRRVFSAARVRAAQAKIAKLERKLTKLDISYRQSLARFLTPVQIRYFLAVS